MQTVTIIKNRLLFVNVNERESGGYYVGQSVILTANRTLKKTVKILNGQKDVSKRMFL